MEPMVPMDGTIRFIRVEENGEQRKISWQRKLLETALGITVTVSRDVISRIIVLPIDIYMHMTGITTLSAGYVFDTMFHLLTGGLAIVIWHPASLLMEHTPVKLTSSRLKMYPVMLLASMYSTRAKVVLGGMLGLETWQSRLIVLWLLWCMQGWRVWPVGDRSRKIVHAMATAVVIYFIPIPVSVGATIGHWGRYMLISAHLSRSVLLSDT